MPAHTKSTKPNAPIAVIGIDIGKNVCAYNFYGRSRNNCPPIGAHLLGAKFFQVNGMPGAALPSPPRTASPDYYSGGRRALFPGTIGFSAG